MTEFNEGDVVILDAGDKENVLPLLGLRNGREYTIIYEGDGRESPANHYWISDGADEGFAKPEQMRKVGE